MHGFHDSNGCLPASGWTVAGPGNPAGKYVGWRPLTAPFIEQENLKRLYDTNLNWWDGANITVASVPVATYRCPSAPDRQVTSAVAKSPRPAMSFPNPLGVTDYEAVMGVQPNSVNPHMGGSFYHSGNRFSPMYRNSTVRLTDVGDGTSATILLVECGGRPLVYRNRIAQPGLNNDQGIGWADSEGPFSFDGAAADGSAEGCGTACSTAMNAKNDNEPYSFHATGSNVLFTDGHVAFVKESVALPTFAALCTMNAGEVVTDY